MGTVGVVDKAVGVVVLGQGDHPVAGTPGRADSSDYRSPADHCPRSGSRHGEASRVPDQQAWVAQRAYLTKSGLDRYQPLLGIRHTASDPGCHSGRTDDT